MCYVKLLVIIYLLFKVELLCVGKTPGEGRTPYLLLTPIQSRTPGCLVELLFRD